MLVVVLLLASGTYVAGAHSEPAGAEIVEIYPNPVAEDDAGEYVVLSVPPETNLTGWTLSDDHRTVALPNVTVSGRVALSTNPVPVRNRTDATVVELAGHVALANSGENVTVSDGDRVRARLSYTAAPEGAVGHVENGTLTWRSLGKTDFPVRTAGPGQVRTFVFPDAGGLPSDLLRSADDRILLAGYTFSSGRATDALIAANERGVNVRVLLEGGPVGGMTARQARLLDRLVAANVSVRVVDGPYARVDHHHAKYAVVDDRAVVLTENWKPAGTGGQSSRGWGVVLTQPSATRALVSTFEADAGWRDAVAWEQFRSEAAVTDGEKATQTFRQRYQPRTFSAANASVLLAPENAETGVIERLDAATESIHVVQVGVGGPDQSFVRALKRAATRGVEVRLLLSRAWYAREDNRAVADSLESWANERDASLSVRLARPRDRFEKIHAKGAIVDGDEVLLGSLNWNDHSARQNREVVIALDGSGPARYYDRVFRDDWRATIWQVTAGLLVAVLAALSVAGFVGRHIAFQDSPSPQACVDDHEHSSVGRY
ncbi:phospholipase [Halorhabdus sp. CBA1104]|uniref:phospholipase D-like domain-containing protein n=1 Tax=Halorhabdus sp. CBA1104 TaxID=1380432 RepID=UPI0012B231C0|nr:phospholipase D-like domain-containing protein [Halorhabdus sp. CBA1104]QGN07500.1 phospholipase [Halorhabdus sp. CBA1104]